MSKRLDLNNIRLGLIPFTDNITMYRHGKDPHVALDRRPAEEDVMTVLVQHMMQDSPKGSQRDVKVGGRWFNVLVKPIETPPGC